MANIQPVVFPILGTATKLIVTVLNFKTNDLNCNTYYQLLTVDNKQLIDGNYRLTDAEFTAWGSDNSYVDTIVANRIGLKIIP